MHAIAADQGIRQEDAVLGFRGIKRAFYLMLLTNGRKR